MSDFDSDEQIDELMPTEVDLDALEREVNLNSSNYNAHLELINACRSCGELERLRSARIRMSSVYPLSPKLWRDWIDDEKQFTINQSDRVTFMRSLFDRAVVDYMSFDAWLDYIQWAVGCGDHSLTRQICERAVSAVGLHVGRGCLIWDAFRIFEKAVLDMQICQEELNSSDSRNSAAGEAVDKQKAIYVSIFKRQLNLPLLGMEATFKEYEEFCANAKESVDTALLNNYKNALSTLEKLRAFEQALLDTEVDDSTTENNSKMENLLAYQNYIDFEVKNGDSPARIKCLFERAITDHCLDSDLWVKYLDWLNRKLRVKSQISLTCYRATRNCPWSTKIWQNYLLSFERWSFDIFRHPQGNSIDIIEETRNNIGNEKILDEIFLRALNEGGYTTATECCQLWLSRIYQIRRNIEISQNRVYEPLRKAFEDGSAFLKEKFSELGWDSDCQFRLSWARAEGLFLKDLTEFRRIFDEIMAEGGNGKKAQAWLQYFGLEREFNPHPSSDNGRFARKILIKAVNSVSDYPESIFAQFLQFELEFGTLSDYDDALYRIEQQRARLKIRSQSKAQNKNELAKKRYQPKGGRSSPTKTKSKRKLEETETENYVPKKPNIVETHAPPPIRSKTDFDFVAPAPPTSKTAGQTPPQKPISCKPAGSKAPLNTTQAGIDSSNYDRTVFVSNLDFAVIDETIRTIFEENVGQVTSVRLIMLRPGRSKGFGYVEFKEPSLLIEALKLDRYKIDGRPMYVSKCVDKKSNDQQSSSSSNIPPHGFTYSTGIEKNKLFIKNLNGRTTEADLEKIFKLYGHLVSVRLVIHKSGQSKGLAYVEFADEQSANRALMATDQSTLMGRRITVAISNPPPKQTKIGGDDQIQRDRSPSTATINLSMTPRVLSSNTTQKRPHLNSGMNRQNGGDSMIENQSTTVNGSGTNVGKSNDEFRKMIMK